VKTTDHEPDDRTSLYTYSLDLNQINKKTLISKGMLCNEVYNQLLGSQTE